MTSEHFFEGFDKREQKFEYQFKIGGVTADMGWLMASGNVTNTSSSGLQAVLTRPIDS